MLKRTAIGAALAVATLASPQVSMAQQSPRNSARDFHYVDRNGDGHWDRAAWRRAEQIRKREEAQRRRAWQRQHAIEQQRERERRLHRGH